MATFLVPALALLLAQATPAPPSVDPAVDPAATAQAPTEVAPGREGEPKKPAREFTPEEKERAEEEERAELRKQVEELQQRLDAQEESALAQEEAITTLQEENEALTAEVDEVYDTAEQEAVARAQRVTTLDAAIPQYNDLNAQLLQGDTPSDDELDAYESQLASALANAQSRGASVQAQLLADSLNSLRFGRAWLDEGDIYTARRSLSFAQELASQARNEAAGTPAPLPGEGNTSALLPGQAPAAPPMPFEIR